MTTAKSLIEKLILRSFYFSGANDLYLKKQPENCVRILGYHEIERSNFEKHVNYLRSKKFNFISMNTLTECWETNTPIPQKSIVLTFDDGWRSNYSQVFPVAREQKIPVMVYLISQIYISGDKPLFFSLAELISSGIKNVPDEVSLERMESSERDDIIFKLKTIYKERVSCSHSLSIEEIKNMLSTGYVSFGSHTSTHPNLNSIPPEESIKEIYKSKSDLESLLKQPIYHFAYPKGFFLNQHFDILKQAGYKTAVTIIPGFNNPKMENNPFKLKRIFITGNDDMSILSAKISGIWYKMHNNKMHNKGVYYS